MALGDVDGDSDVDIVFGNGPVGYARIGRNRLYLNDGTGRYTEAVLRLPDRLGETYGVALGDVDGDSDLDLVLANYRLRNLLYLNDGSGTFTDVTAARMPAEQDGSVAVALGDVDGDSDLDIVFGNYLEATWLYLNDGTGTFVDATAARMPAYSDITNAVAMGDVEGDGDPDLVFANSGQDRLYLNDGTGSHTDATAARLPSYSDATQAVALGDVDGDSDLDLVVGNGYNALTTAPNRRNRLYLNDGTGAYSDVTATHLPTTANDFTTAVALGDVDGDADLDLVCGNAGASSGQQTRLYLNDGSGRYTDVTASHMPVDSDFTRAVALGDVDGDSDLDLVLGNSRQGTATGQERLYLNDGTGRYTDATTGRLPAFSDETFGIALGDVDGDLDLDLVTGNWGFSFPGTPNRLYLNDGTGRYTDATAGRLPAILDRTRAVALGDVDGDLDLDLVFGNFGQSQLYLNDGQGFYTDATAARLPAYSAWTNAVSLGDLDGDSDLDLVFGNSLVSAPYRSPQNLLYLNDGTGHYTDASAARMRADDDTTLDQALGDVDGDGDVDMVFGTDGPERVYQNLQRHLDAPLLLRVGRTYTLEAYARYGPALINFAVPLLSTATANIPMPPFGTFGLAPAQTVTAPTINIHHPPGVGASSFTVPNSSTLAGLPLHAQVFLIPSGFVPRFTNVTTDVVIR